MYERSWLGQRRQVFLSYKLSLKLSRLGRFPSVAGKLFSLETGPCRNGRIILKYIWVRGVIYRLLFLGHRSFIRSKTQTAVINIVSLKCMLTSIPNVKFI